MVIFDQIFFDVSDSNEPGRNSFVNKRCLTSPAERIVVLNNSLFHQSSILFEVSDDDFVCCFDVESFVGGHFLRENTVFVKRHGRTVGRNDLLFNAEFVIVLTEPRGTVHNACTVGVSHEGTRLDSETAVFCPVCEEVEEGHILNA